MQIVNPDFGIQGTVSYGPPNSERRGSSIPASHSRADYLWLRQIIPGRNSDAHRGTPEAQRLPFPAQPQDGFGLGAMDFRLFRRKK